MVRAKALSSTDHLLVSIWDEILSGLVAARGKGKGKAVVLTGIDISKSFLCCSHQEILSAYQKLGLSDWAICMHACCLLNQSESEGKN